MSAQQNAIIPGPAECRNTEYTDSPAPPPPSLTDGLALDGLFMWRCRASARRLVQRLNELGIGHRYEEFPNNHTGVDCRMDESLPFLAQALSGGC